MLQLQMVPLDSPTHLGYPDQIIDLYRRRQHRQPVFLRLRFLLGPLDQKLFFMSGIAPFIVVLGSSTPDRREPQLHLSGAALAPGNCFPRTLG